MAFRTNCNMRAGRDSYGFLLLAYKISVGTWPAYATCYYADRYLILQRFTTTPPSPHRTSSDSNYKNDFEFNYWNSVKVVASRRADFCLTFHETLIFVWFRWSLWYEGWNRVTEFAVDCRSWPGLDETNIHASKWNVGNVENFCEIIIR